MRTRKIRPYDFGPADAPAEMPEAEDGPVVVDRLAVPYNDNARETPARTAAPSRSGEPDADTSGAGETEIAAEGAAPLCRRRGALVTRWIGHAAQRRRSQARMDRMRQTEGGAERTGR